MAAKVAVAGPGGLVMAVMAAAAAAYWAAAPWEGGGSANWGAGGGEVTAETEATARSWCIMSGRRDSRRGELDCRTSHD